MSLVSGQTGLTGDNEKLLKRRTIVLLECSHEAGGNKWLLKTTAREISLFPPSILSFSVCLYSICPTKLLFPKVFIL